MAKKRTAIEKDERDLYAKIDFIVAAILVVVTLVTAEQPNQRQFFQRQTAAPYQPRGWRPNGPAFNPTLRLQKQEQAPPEPAPSYGPPPSVSYGPPQSEATTTEQPTTTEADIETTTLESQVENLEVESRNENPAQPQKQTQAQPGEVYVLLPQGQSLIYAAPLRVANAAPLVEAKEPNKDVELVKEPRLAPVQAIPALAKIQAPILLAKYEQAPQLVQFQQIQAVPLPQYASSLSQTSVYTPYSSSFVQVYQ